MVLGVATASGVIALRRTVVVRYKRFPVCRQCFYRHRPVTVLWQPRFGEPETGPRFRSEVSHVSKCRSRCGAGVDGDPGLFSDGLRGITTGRVFMIVMLPRVYLMIPFMSLRLKQNELLAHDSVALNVIAYLT